MREIIKSILITVFHLGVLAGALLLYLYSIPLVHG
jgi:hypothetical protein